jgi:hypothetical protein
MKSPGQKATGAKLDCYSNATHKTRARVEAPAWAIAPEHGVGSTRAACIQTDLKGTVKYQNCCPAMRLVQQQKPRPAEGSAGVNGRAPARRNEKPRPHWRRSGQGSIGDNTPFHAKCAVGAEPA